MLFCKFQILNKKRQFFDWFWGPGFNMFSIVNLYKIFGFNFKTGFIPNIYQCTLWAVSRKVGILLKHKNLDVFINYNFVQTLYSQMYVTEMCRYSLHMSRALPGTCRGGGGGCLSTCPFAQSALLSRQLLLLFCFIFKHPSVKACPI